MINVEFSRYDTADYLKTEYDIAAYLEAVMEDSDSALMSEAQQNVARARTRISDGNANKRDQA